MLWLPTPLAHPMCVAVADRSACAIERALLSDSPQAAAAELAGAMLADGRLVMWVQELHGDEAKSIADLSEWLAANFGRILPRLRMEADDAWRPLRDWDARGLAAGAIAAARTIDPAHNGHWRTNAADYVARLIGTLRDQPCAWPDDSDEEFRGYVSVDSGIAWRLPRLIQRLFNANAAREDFEARVHTARLEAMKELAYGASHEINNPLANISGRAQMLLKGEADPHRRRMLVAIDAQALRAHEMISDLMHFARPPRLDRQPLCVGTLIESLTAELTSELAERRITCELIRRGACDLVTADHDQLHMAIKGVIRNAIEAIGVDGRIVIRAGTVEGGEHLELTIADTGGGIPDEIRPQIFDPFFSGREAGRGLGFGLARAWRVVTEHGGAIELAEDAGFSTAFRILFPLATR